MLASNFFKLDWKSLAQAQTSYSFRCLLPSPAMRLTQEWLYGPRDVELRFAQVDALS